MAAGSLTAREILRDLPVSQDDVKIVSRVLSPRHRVAQRIQDLVFKLILQDHIEVVSRKFPGCSVLS